MELWNERITSKTVDGIELLEFKDLACKSDLIHSFSLKPLNFRNKEGVCENYQKLMAALQIDYDKLIKPTQRHTDNILVVEKKQNSDTADIQLEYLDGVDALITNQPNLALATTSADCLCAILYDETKKVIGNVHSGWRGTCQKIIQKTAQKMMETYQCHPKDIRVYLMPSIRKCHFEVDTDVMEIFSDLFGYMPEVISVGQKKEEMQKYNIDNVKINVNLLNEIGIENIYDSGICSVCNSNKVHSRRADGEGFGLGTTIVMMK